MNDLELAVRTIDEHAPQMSTEALQKWHSILRTALIKVEKELTAGAFHTCDMCFMQECGYRDEMPIAWHRVDGVIACFQHEYADVKKYAAEQNADEPFDSAPKSTEDSLEDLMSIL